MEDLPADTQIHANTLRALPVRNRHPAELQYFYFVGTTSYIRQLALLLTLFLFTHAGTAQTYHPEAVGKKAREVYDQAYEAAMQGNYSSSLVLLDKALSLDPRFLEAVLSQAGIHAERKDYVKSVSRFEAAFRQDSLFCRHYLLPYSISLAGTGAFDKALEAVNRFLALSDLNPQSIRSANYRKRTYEFALAQARNHNDTSYRFLPVNLGPGINTRHHEYYPSFTIDGRTMIFTRRVDQDEDFYESTLTDDSWSRARPVPGRINTTLNEGAQTLSQDGLWLIYTGCNYPEGEGSCDLYIAYRKKDGQWTEGENLGRLVNTDLWESAPSLSPDKKDLYFSSNRNGGYGGKDIWVTHRLPNGTWSRPENLGAAINTSADETCPFIHPDNQTLYFNSNGLTGYGMADLFLVRRDTAMAWGKPENLGYPINTIDDEGSLVLTSDGQTAYYASDRAGDTSGLDLYRFTIRPAFRAARTYWISGHVFDKASRTGLPSSVVLTDINNRKFRTDIRTDEDGRFLITLPAGRDYALHVNRKGYLFYSDRIALTGTLPDSSLTLPVPLQPIVPGAGIILNNIYFGNNESTLQPASLEELDKLVLLMNENPTLNVEVGGHTDYVGKKEANRILSLKRAQSVVQYLVQKGIAAPRAKAMGYGDTRNIADNLTEEGKKRNRRTEITVLSR